MAWRKWIVATVVTVAVGLVVSAVAIWLGAGAFLAGALGGAIGTSVGDKVSPR